MKVTVAIIVGGFVALALAIAALFAHQFATNREVCEGRNVDRAVLVELVEQFVADDDVVATVRERLAPLKC